MNTFDSAVLNLTDVIYPIDSSSPTSTSMTIRPPTPSTPTAATYSLFEPRQDICCSQCKSTDMLSNVFNPSWNTTRHIPCVKLTNIPWDASQNDIRLFFGNLHLPSTSIYAQSIHILMDRTTGKTMSDAYVELATFEDLQCAIETKNQRTLKGRMVSVKACSQDDLLNAIFPKWRGTFKDTAAIPPDTKVVQSMSTAAGGGGSACPPFITREEINSLLVVCKNYKLHFSRKCAERPFENIISIITKYPWHQAHLITTMHRDHVYEMLKLSIESLMNHLSKDYVQIEPSLLSRLVRAGLLCPAFTERQKVALLQVTGMTCPMDLTYLFMNHEFVPQAATTMVDPVFYHSPLSSRHSYYGHLQTNNYNRSYPASTRSGVSYRNRNDPLIAHCQKTGLSPWAQSYSPDKETTVWPSAQTTTKPPPSNSIMTI